MKALTPYQYLDILTFIQKYHSFCLFRREEQREYIRKNFPNMKPEYGMNIKYIENCFDTRDGSIWSLSFTTNGIDYSFKTNSLVGFTPERNPEYDNLYDTIMAFLKGELKNHEYFIDREEER